MAGLGDPNFVNMPMLEYLSKGIKSFQVKRGLTPPRTRLPITPAILRKLREVWDRQPHNADHIMLWAACTTCFFGFLRSGEITTPPNQFDPGAHLAFGDVTLDCPSNPTLAQINIKASKTDPFRVGVSIYLGRTGNNLCPVTAMTAYLAVRGGEPGPFFKFSNNRPLSRELLVKHLREALTSAGIDATKYSGHSFRSGTATTAAAAGLEDSLIKTLERWFSLPSLYSYSERKTGHFVTCTFCLISYSEYAPVVFIVHAQLLRINSLSTPLMSLWGKGLRPSLDGSCWYWPLSPTTP